MSGNNGFSGGPMQGGQSQGVGGFTNPQHPQVRQIGSHGNQQIRGITPFQQQPQAPIFGSHGIQHSSGFIQPFNQGFSGVGYGGNFPHQVPQYSLAGSQQTGSHGLQYGGFQQRPVGSGAFISQQPWYNVQPGYPQANLPISSLQVPRFAHSANVRAPHNQNRGSFGGVNVNRGGRAQLLSQSSMGPRGQISSYSSGRSVPATPSVPVCRNCLEPHHIKDCDRLCMFCGHITGSTAGNCVMLNRCRQTEFRTRMFNIIAGRSQDDSGGLLTHQKMAAKFKASGFSFPDGWVPYRKRKGDYFYDGGIQVYHGRVSENYHGDLRYYLKEYEESLILLDSLVTYRYLPYNKIFVYLMNKNDVMLDHYINGRLHPNSRHDAEVDFVGDFEEYGEEDMSDHQSEDEEAPDDDAPIRLPGPMAQRIDITPYTNLPVLQIPLEYMETGKYHRRSMVLLNKMARSAPIVIRLVTSKFNPFATHEENKDYILASYRGKCTRRFVTYDSRVYVELVLEQGFYSLFEAFAYDMNRLGANGNNATPLFRLGSRIQTMSGEEEDVFLVFRTTIGSELASQRCRDLSRTMTVVPNRVSSVLFWNEGDNDEEFNKKCVPYSPWYPPEDAVQLFIGGPRYVNEYRSIATRRISSIKDMKNRFILRFNQRRVLEKDRQVAEDKGSHGPKLMPPKYLIDFPVYFAERSMLYEIFDEVVASLHALNPLFDPTPAQRYFTVELLIMGHDLVLMKVFPGAGKSLFTMISIYVRIVYYLRKTGDGKNPYPASLPKVRLPRFLYIAVGNETIDNCAAKFLTLVRDLANVYDPQTIISMIGRKYAKEFTTISIDPRLVDIANKGEQFFIDKKLLIFTTHGVMVNRRAFPSWVPDVIVFEEASQVNMDDFIRSVVRDTVSGKKNKKGQFKLCQHGMIDQIIMLGDTQQLVSDIRASYNVSHLISHDWLYDPDWNVLDDIFTSGRKIEIPGREKPFNLENMANTIDIPAFNVAVHTCNPHQMIHLTDEFRSDYETIGFALDAFQREDFRPDNDGWANGAVPRHPNIEYRVDLNNLGFTYVRINELYPSSGLDHGYALVHVSDEVKKEMKLISSKNTSSAQANEILDKIELLFRKKVSSENILVICPYENQRALVYSKIIKRMGKRENHLNLDNWARLLTKVMVTEKAIGEEDRYVFLSLTLAEGNPGFLKDIMDRLLQCIRNPRLSVVLSRAVICTMVYLDVDQREKIARNNHTESIDRFILYCKNKPCYIRM